MGEEQPQVPGEREWWQAAHEQVCAGPAAPQGAPWKRGPPPDGCWLHADGGPGWVGVCALSGGLCEVGAARLRQTHRRALYHCLAAWRRFLRRARQQTSSALQLRWPRSQLLGSAAVV